MKGMIGMMQVLAGYIVVIPHHPWRISHAGTWEEQSLPPLALGFNLRRKIDGQEQVAFLRLRLVLVKASKIPSAQAHIPTLKHIVRTAYDTQGTDSQYRSSERTN